MNQYIRHILTLSMFLLTGVLTCTAAVRITFSIADAETGLPLDYAAVSLSGSESNSLTGGNTDIEGKFTTTVSPGKWRVDISLVGYKPSRKYLTITSDEEIAIALQPDEPLTEVIVTAREARNSTSAS
ncbi:MAG: carboxypeptidase-like regulatory domain-containing protein, partial [Duncaniella sp.]|nr:carboxypeptidase-like regulatory domain-containing protein [Duncaniella sp.]